MRFVFRLAAVVAGCLYLAAMTSPAWSARNANKTPPSPPAAAQDPVIRELQGDAPAQKRTAAELEATYAKIVDELLGKLGGDDLAAAGRAQETIQRMAFYAGRPDGEPNRAAFCKVVASRLEKSPAAAQPWLLAELQRIGQGESVDAVAALMNSKDAVVKDSARRALQNNPSAEAGAALRKAIASADSAQWKAMLIDALAFRCDPADAPLFTKEAASEDETVAMAAYLALAKSGDASAAAVLAAGMNRGSDAAKRTAADASILLAKRLLSTDKAAATAIYRKFLAEKGHLKCAALLGLAARGKSAFCG